MTAPTTAFSFSERMFCTDARPGPLCSPDSHALGCRYHGDASKTDRDLKAALERVASPSSYVPASQTLVRVPRFYFYSDSDYRDYVLVCTVWDHEEMDLGDPCSTSRDLIQFLASKIVRTAREVPHVAAQLLAEVFQKLMERL